MTDPCNIAASLPRLAREQPDSVAMRCPDGAGRYTRALTYAQQNASNSELTALLNDPRELRQFQQAYQTRQRVTSRAGQTVAFQRYGDELAGARKELSDALAVQKDMKAELKQVTAKLEQIRKENKKNSDDNADKSNAALDRLGRNGTRKG